VLNTFKAKIDCLRVAQKLSVFIRYPSDPKPFLREGIPVTIFSYTEETPPTAKFIGLKKLKAESAIPLLPSSFT